MVPPSPPSTPVNWPLAVFPKCDGGVIFRPSATKIKCGNGADAGGICRGGTKYNAWCRVVGDTGDPTTYASDQFPGDGCVGLQAGSSWLPGDVGTFLERVGIFQRDQGQSFYNEFIVDADAWASEEAPHTIEFFFAVASAGDEARAKIARFHAAYVDQFELDPDENPLLLLHLDDWAQPLSLPPPPAVNLPPASPQHLWAIVG